MSFKKGDKLYMFDSGEIEEALIWRVGTKYVYLVYPHFVLEADKKKDKKELLEYLNSDNLIDKHIFRSRQEAVMAKEANEKYRTILHEIVKSYGNPFKHLKLKEIRIIYNMLIKEK